MGEQWDPWSRGAPPGGYSRTGYDPTADVPRPDAREGSTGFDAADLVGAPPVGWLVGALALGVAAVAIALTLGASIGSVRSVGWAAAAWFLAGPVAIGLLAVFVQRDVGQRSMPIYRTPPWVPALYWAAIAAAAAGIGLGAWRIADWVGHL